MSTKSSYKPYRPGPKDMCLCGSGQKFRNCCRNLLPGTDIGNRTREMMGAQRWLRAIKHGRADVAQYTIWHRSHTLPGVLRDSRLRHGFLMDIDIEALSEYVEILMGAYAQYGWLNKLPEALDRLRENILDPRWQRKISYQRAICALWQDDNDRARQEIAPLLPITPADEDVDLLQLHVDIHRDQMGLSEKIAFYERIVELTSSSSDKLQYGGAHAVELLLAGDDAGAIAKFDEVIALGRRLEEDAPLSTTAEIWFCKSLELRSAVAKDWPLIDEIVARLRKIADTPETLTSAGRTMVIQSIGDAYRYAGLHMQALQAYHEAFAIQPHLAIHIFEADSELRRGQVDEAFRLIRSVAVDKLDSAERADHAFIFFAIALARRDRQSLADARELLKAAESPAPYFNMLRLQYIVKVDEAIEAFDANRQLPGVGPVLLALQTISRYVTLQPNISGVGVNLNALIDDFVAKAVENARRAQDETPTYPPAERE